MNKVTPIRPCAPAPLPTPSMLEEPSTSAAVPGFPHVVVFHDADRGRDLVCIEFRGTAEDLLACGAATPEMLAINAPKGPRVKRVDADGDPARSTRYWRSTNLETGEPCAPFRWHCIRRWKPEARVRQLPGASEAIAARVTYDRWRELRFGGRESAFLALMNGGNPQLRLVVDNTQEAP